MVHDHGMSSGQVSPRAALTAAAFAGTTLALAALALAPLGCATNDGVGTSDGGLSGGGTGGTEAGSGGAAGAAGADSGPAECLTCPDSSCFINESPGTACARQAGECSGDCLPWVGYPQELRPEGCWAPQPSRTIGCYHPRCPQEYKAQYWCAVEGETGFYFGVGSITMFEVLDHTKYRPCTSEEFALFDSDLLSCPADAGTD